MLRVGREALAAPAFARVDILGTVLPTVSDRFHVGFRWWTLQLQFPLTSEISSRKWSIETFWEYKKYIVFSDLRESLLDVEF